MHVLLLLLLLIVINACPVPRSVLISCFRNLLDKDHNNIITEYELDKFLESEKAYTCLPANLVNELAGKTIINTCDMNNDGQLSIYDWSVHHNSCINTKERIELICNICVQCGWKHPMQNADL